MLGMSYFNIGYKSEKIRLELEKLEENKDYAIPESTLSSILEILRDCLDMNEKDSLVKNIESGRGYENFILYPLIFEVFPSTPQKGALDDLRGIYDIIRDIKAKSDKENLQKVKSFFDRLSNACLGKISTNF